jgi:hypothetical protein
MDLTDRPKKLMWYEFMDKNAINKTKE